MAFVKKQTILANFYLILEFKFVGEIVWQIFLPKTMFAGQKKFDEIDSCKNRLTNIIRETTLHFHIPYIFLFVCHFPQLRSLAVEEN
jgi:hypothetical protein